MAGNIDEQPATRLIPYWKVGDLPSSRVIHRDAFFFVSDHGIGERDRHAIVRHFQDFLSLRQGVYRKFGEPPH